MSDEENRKALFIELSLIWDELIALNTPRSVIYREQYDYKQMSAEELTREIEERRAQLKVRRKWQNIED